VTEAGLRVVPKKDLVSPNPYPISRSSQDPLDVMIHGLSPDSKSGLATALIGGVTHTAALDVVEMVVLGPAAELEGVEISEMGADKEKLMEDFISLVEAGDETDVEDRLSRAVAE
jgi:hypothetical protein